MSVKFKLDRNYWQKVLVNPKEAKKGLLSFKIDGKTRIKEVELANGEIIPIEEISDAQALKFMRRLYNETIKKGKK